MTNLNGISIDRFTTLTLKCLTYFCSIRKTSNPNILNVDTDSQELSAERLLSSEQSSCPP